LSIIGRAGLRALTAVTVDCRSTQPSVLRKTANECQILGSVITTNGDVCFDDADDSSLHGFISNCFFQIILF